MRLLLFSDLHNNQDAARQLIRQSGDIDVDVAVGAGDFGNGRRDYMPCLEILRDLKCPLVLVAGNNESPDELRSVCANWPNFYVLHGDSIQLENQTFFGLSGGVPTTPFGDWSFDLTENQAALLLEKCPVGAVLISHSPPHGLVDVSSRGDHLGSLAVRAAIERIQPPLLVCGHIHGSAGQSAQLGATTVINAGPHGAVFEI